LVFFVRVASAPALPPRPYERATPRVALLGLVGHAHPTFCWALPALALYWLSSNNSCDAARAGAIGMGEPLRVKVPAVNL
jgi:hypothetical protein